MSLSLNTKHILPSPHIIEKNMILQEEGIFDLDLPSDPPIISNPVSELAISPNSCPSPSKSALPLSSYPSQTLPITPPHHNSDLIVENMSSIMSPTIHNDPRFSQVYRRTISDP